ncbi:adenylate/guanylate cyclase domain-containing protein [Litoribrevibacter euphylliae]|uniref:Adenylate/guanylate cyclase domain-containing protein n=1 Tax=Litoribrevibacter euphylliae TaxID=1834034 RepID=A0ABV7HDS3_9GAMM
MKQFFSAVVSKLKSLHTIFVLLFTVLLSVTSWLTWNQLDIHVRSDLIHQYRSIVTTTAEQAAQTARPLIQTNDRLSLQVYAQESIDKRQLDSITFYSPSQEILAYANRKNVASISKRVTSSSEITANDTTLGSVTVVLSTNAIEEILNQTTSQIILISVAVWILGIILMRSLFHIYEMKVTSLAHRIKSPQREDSYKSSFLELKPLENEVVLFQQKLLDQQELDNNLSQLLNPQALHQAAKESETNELSVRARYSSVLYVKALGLENINSTLSKRDSARLISEYVNLLQQAAKLYNGFVQVQANGLTIIFGAPQKMNDHCLHAVCAASFLYRLLNNYNQQRLSLSKPLLKFQIAIHSGEVFCFDTPEQASMAIFGDVIFEAAQLASLAKPGQILLSEQARKEPELENKVICKGPYSLGTQQSLLVYQVSSLEDSYDQLIERQVKHIASLRQPA